uniref:Uncharacterized protein n=1 Tax=Arundo donax TaxID=35708 RepID=A0A0A9AHI9_ARUDO
MQRCLRWRSCPWIHQASYSVPVDGDDGRNTSRKQARYVEFWPASRFRPASLSLVSGLERERLLPG